eukprot:c8953_g1_i1.p1 GENE.c8953_g1_i1~~c8953_g1_i1.p1  ORF type:complete len:104 (-),score=21.15 c8953_g1_i1:55-366(-)
MWFWDFVCALFENIQKLPPATTFYDITSDAYNRTLSPRHPWLVRKTVSAALNFLPYRAQFFELIGKPDNEETNKVLLTLVQQMGDTQAELWGYFRQNNMHELA